jgi:hypothetical protein
MEKVTINFFLNLCQISWDKIFIFLLRFNYDYYFQIEVEDKAAKKHEDEGDVEEEEEAGEEEEEEAGEEVDDEDEEEEEAGEDVEDVGEEEEEGFREEEEEGHNSRFKYHAQCLYKDDIVGSKHRDHLLGDKENNKKYYFNSLR